MEIARSTPSNAWWRVYQRDRGKVAEQDPNMHHNPHSQTTPAQGVFFQPLLSFCWLQFHFPLGEQKKKKEHHTFRFEKKCVRWMYEGFGGCNKKQQMAEEWLHAPVHFWAPGRIPTPMTPAEPLQWIAAQGSRIIPLVLERRGLAQAVVTHSSSCSHSIPPTGFKDNGYFLIFCSPTKLLQLQ